MSIIHTQLYHSPCGDLLLEAFDGKLCRCDWTCTARCNSITDISETPSDLTQEAVLQLEDYFAGRRTSFGIPLSFVGTDFQKQVWNALMEIPYGETISYRELAVRIGRPEAVRAVAGANHANVISIFVPCHRVIGSNHSLVGYAGGLPAKQYLLDLESLFIVTDKAAHK